MSSLAGDVREHRDDIAAVDVLQQSELRGEGPGGTGGPGRPGLLEEGHRVGGTGCPGTGQGRRGGGYCTRDLKLTLTSLFFMGGAQFVFSEPRVSWLMAEGMVREARTGWSAGGKGGGSFTYLYQG